MATWIWSFLSEESFVQEEEGEQQKDWMFLLEFRRKFPECDVTGDEKDVYDEDVLLPTHCLGWAM